MSKGEATRARIVARAAPLFNQRGYAGASMAEIMAAAGLEKGGIYNHFASKDDLAAASFDYAVGRLRSRMQAALADQPDAVARLLAIVEVFRANTADPPVAGGCPLLNTAVDADDGHPLLRERVRHELGSLCRLVQRIVAEGVARGELRPETDPAALATVLVATLEGAIMLGRLFQDPAHFDRAAAHLTQVIEAARR